MFEFNIQAKCSKSRARTAQFKLLRGDVETPMFMPCGTKGMVKTMLPHELEEIGVQLMLGNTYHLFLRPGSDLIAEAGGLPEFNGWNKPMLTDSGGFQVFSLQGNRTKNAESFVDIDENGVNFKSYLDGSKHRFTPERVMRIQHDLGADIMMAFDECSAADVPKDYAKAAMERTHRWFERCKSEHSTSGSKQALFPIVQGGMFADLRKESADFLAKHADVGIAIGGLSVGETKKQMADMLDVVVPQLPEDKPRYLMGVGSPEDLVEGVYRGVDMFDCVLPTRLARHGCFWTKTGRHNLKNTKFKNDMTPFSVLFEEGQKVSMAYVRHLFIEGEITALRLLSIHNLQFLINLMSEIRKAIKNDRFMEFREEFYKTWESN